MCYIALPCVMLHCLTLHYFGYVTLPLPGFNISRPVLFYKQPEYTERASLVLNFAFLFGSVRLFSFPVNCSRELTVDDDEMLDQ